MRLNVLIFQMNTKSSSPFLIISCFLGLIFFISCSKISAPQPEDKSIALLKASHFVELYGQIIGPTQTNYVEGLKNRLESPLENIGRIREPFRLILLSTNHPISLCAGSGVILLSQGFVRLLRSEAELAFVIAHEMSHDILGHTQNPPSLLESEQEHNSELEIKADEFAIVIMVAAGYDPRMATHALRNAYASKETLPLSEYGYPTLDDRLQHIQDKINAIDWEAPGTVDRRDFQLFKNSLN